MFHKIECYHWPWLPWLPWLEWLEWLFTVLLAWAAIFVPAIFPPASVAVPGTWLGMLQLTWPFTTWLTEQFTKPELYQTVPFIPLAFTWDAVPAWVPPFPWLPTLLCVGVIVLECPARTSVTHPARATAPTASFKTSIWVIFELSSVRKPRSCFLIFGSDFFDVLIENMNNEGSISGKFWESSRPIVPLFLGSLSQKSNSLESLRFLDSEEHWIGNQG
jgi:hypothetical protein